MSSGVLFDAPGPKARRRHAVLTVLGALVLLGLLWLVYRRLDDKGQLTSAMWKPFLEASTWQDYILPGLLGTLKAAGTAMVGAAVFGIVFAMARMSHVRPLRWVAGFLARAGHFAADKALVAALVSGGPQAIRWLIQEGVSFDLTEGSQRMGGTLLRKKPGGATAARLLSYRDFTGLELMRALREATLLQPGITILDRHPALELLSDDRGRCAGAVLHDFAHGRPVLARAGAVARGGCTSRAFPPPTTMAPRRTVWCWPIASAPRCGR